MNFRYEFSNIPILVLIAVDFQFQNTHSNRGGGVITKLSWFCVHYNGIILYSTMHCYLFLACSYVGFLYIPVQKLIKKLSHNPPNSVGNMYILV